MENENVFRRAVDDSLAYASGWKTRNNKPVIGYFCSYVPEEIIYAAGALPFRVFADLPHTPHSDSHLQPYSCNYVRSVFEWALSGKTEFIDGFAFAQTCDTMQRFADIWQNNDLKGFALNLVLPARFDSESSNEYMQKVFVKFRKELEEKLNIEIHARKLSDSITLFNRIRHIVHEIYEIRLSKPGVMSNADFYYFIKASSIMDRDDFLKEAEKVHKKLSEKTVPELNMKKVILVGGPCNIPEIFSYFDEADIFVADDDLCNGARSFDTPVSPYGDLMASITQRYFDRIACPTKYKSLNHRQDLLLQLAGNIKADGVVYLQEKFCEPHAFDYPYIKKVFEDAGTPMVYVEMNSQTGNNEALRNRLEAFFEMLKNK